MADIKLWSEKYRPKTIDDCIIPKKIKKTFKGYIKNNNLPNLMLCGYQGIGKTTCARAIVNELKAECLFVDCSTDNGKAMIDEMVIPFASTISISNPNTKKIVLLDEADGLSQVAMRSFRQPMERFSSNVVFIFTGNYSEKFIGPLKSRCTEIDMSISKEEKAELCVGYFKRCEKILKENDIQYDPAVLARFIAKFFPDLRKVINELQSYASAESKIDEGILSIASDAIAASLYPLLTTKDFEGCKKWIAENVSSTDDIFSSLFGGLNEYIKPEKQPDVILCLAQYQDYATRVANQSINLLACFIEIMSSL